MGRRQRLDLVSKGGAAGGEGRPTSQAKPCMQGLEDAFEHKLYAVLFGFLQFDFFFFLAYGIVTKGKLLTEG